MKILVSSHCLDIVGGSETFTFTIIEELKRLGHDVEYFTFIKGFVSSKIETDLGVYFMSKSKYDLILANHYTTVEKLYRKGFIIQTCHGIYPTLEQPHVMADAYVSISQEVQNHLAKLACPSILVYNSINLERFKPKTQIKPKPKSLLSLCHSQEANTFIKDMCEEFNLDYYQAYKYEKPVWQIEDIINKVDIVVGLGRSAYEAMSCGRPVIVFDNRRYFDAYGDGYIRNILGLSIQNNCSGRYSKKSFDKTRFIDSLNQYNPEDSKYFRSFAEQNFDVQKNIQLYFDYQNTVIKRKRQLKRLKKVVLTKSILGPKLFKKIAKVLKRN